MLNDLTLRLDSIFKKSSLSSIPAIVLLHPFNDVFDHNMIGTLVDFSTKAIFQIVNPPGSSPGRFLRLHHHRGDGVQSEAAPSPREELRTRREKV